MQLKKLLILLCCGTFLQLGAQDFHNSYWQYAPMIVNPAFTGAYYGNLRANVIGRDQGRPVAGAGNEFQDLSLTLDYNIDFGLTDGDWVSVGLTTSRSYSAGAGDFRRQFSGFTGAYHLAYGKKKDKVFTIGAKYGAYSTTFNNANPTDYEDTFGILNQGQISNDISTLQTSIAGSGQGNNGSEKAKNDFGVGLMLTTPMSKTADLRMGVAVDRILNQFVSRDTASTTGTGGPTFSSQRFGRRIAAHISIYSSINNKLTFNPNIVFQRVGTSNNLLIQGLFNYLMDPVKELSLNFGLGVRLVNSTDIPIYLGVDVNSWRVGLSYDTNVAGLRPSDNTFGALEVGISKIFNWKKKPTVDPKFICPRL